MQSDYKPIKVNAENDINQINESGELKAPTSLPPVKKFKLADEELLEQYRVEKDIVLKEEIKKEKT
jgi:hypothetical protein